MKMARMQRVSTTALASYLNGNFENIPMINFDFTHSFTEIIPYIDAMIELDVVQKNFLDLLFRASVKHKLGTSLSWLALDMLIVRTGTKPLLVISNTLREVGDSETLLVNCPVSDVITADLMGRILLGICFMMLVIGLAIKSILWVGCSCS